MKTKSNKNPAAVALGKLSQAKQKRNRRKMLADRKRGADTTNDRLKGRTDIRRAAALKAWVTKREKAEKNRLKSA